MIVLLVLSVSNQLSFCQFPKFQNKANVRDDEIFCQAKPYKIASPLYFSRIQSLCQNQRLGGRGNLSLTGRIIFLFFSPSPHPVFMSQRSFLSTLKQEFYCSTNCISGKVCARIPIRKSSFFGVLAFSPTSATSLGCCCLTVASPALSESLFSVGHLTKTGALAEAGNWPLC